MSSAPKHATDHSKKKRYRQETHSESEFEYKAIIIISPCASIGRMRVAAVRHFRPHRPQGSDPDRIHRRRAAHRHRHRRTGHEANRRIDGNIASVDRHIIKAARIALGAKARQVARIAAAANALWAAAAKAQRRSRICGRAANRRSK